MAVPGTLVSGLFALAFCMLLAGCVSFGGGKAPAQLYVLRVDAGTPPHNVTTTLAQSVVVSEPVTPRMLSVARVPVLLPGEGLTYLHGANWAERPASMFRALIVDTIRIQGKHLVVEDDEGGARAGTRLSGRLEALDYDARSHSVVVRFDALLTYPNGTISSRRFEARQMRVAPEAGSVIPALNRAANKVAQEVADWLQ